MVRKSRSLTRYDPRAGGGRPGEMRLGDVWAGKGGKKVAILREAGDMQGFSSEAAGSDPGFRKVPT